MVPKEVSLLHGCSKGHRPLLTTTRLQPYEHGGLPGIFLQPIEKTLLLLARDFHELLCGPASSAPGAVVPQVALKRATVKAAAKKAGALYGTIDEN